MACKTEKVGIDIVCPWCQSTDSVLTIDLNDMIGQFACECSNCKRQFSPNDAYNTLRQQLDSWHVLLEWVSLIYEAKLRAAGK